MARLQSYNSINRFFSLNRDENFIRLFCSSITPEKSAKRRSMTEEERTIAVKTYVQEYTETHFGKYPSCSTVRKEVGGSWNILKEIYTKVCDDLKASNSQHKINCKMTERENLSSEASAGSVQPESSQDGGEALLQTFLENEHPKQLFENELTAVLANGDVKHDQTDRLAVDSGLGFPKNEIQKNDTEETRDLPIITTQMASGSDTEDDFDLDSFLSFSKRSRQPSMMQASPVIAANGTHTLCFQNNLHNSLNNFENQNILQIQNSQKFENENPAFRILQRIKLLGRDRRMENEKNISQAGSDDENDCDTDFSAFEYPDPGIRNEPIVPKGGSKIHKMLQEKRININCPVLKSKNQSNDRETDNILDQETNVYSILVFFPKKQAWAHDVNKVFGGCGSIDEVQVILSEMEHVQHCYGLIKFSTRGGLRRALKKQNVVIYGCDVKDKKSGAYMPQEGKINIHLLVVMFLKPDASKEMVKNAFRDCGKINQIRITQSKMGHVRHCYAVIQFNTKEELQKALLKRNVRICGADVAIEAVVIRKTIHQESES